MSEEKWMDGPPPREGWWRTRVVGPEPSTGRQMPWLRWWSGLYWSVPIEDDASVTEFDRVRHVRSVDQVRQVQWLDGTHVEDMAADPMAEVRPEPFVATKLPTAADMLRAAAGHIDDRAAAYDKPEGERSMSQTVVAFNAITGHTVSESEGWLFMEVLKAVRDFTTPKGHADSQEDRVAYAALGAEARRAGR